VSLDAAVPGLAPTTIDGSAATFDALYRQISPRLKGYLRAAEPAEADDLEADVWLAITAQLDRFVGDENGFQALAFTIARRRVADHRRRRYRRRTDLVGNDALAAHPDRDHFEADVIAALGTRDAVDELERRLPASQADVIRLRVLAGLTVDETSAILDRSPGAVRILHHRALKRLRA
jgi:RNA polymerase sigma-70 factor (ECF subfamily)